MPCVLDITTCVLLTIGPFGNVGPGDAPDGGISPRPAEVAQVVELVNLSSEQEQSVSRIAALFGDAGLQLPRLVVRGSANRADCSDHEGVHRRHGEESEIVLCSSPTSTWERRVVAHELAHAWVAAEVTSDRRAAFREVRGWQVWRDYELADWRDNGTEQAAEIIAWGVFDKATPLEIDVGSCAALRDAYVALTGIEPAHRHTRLCDPRVVSRR
jgi:hypothetical protein